MELLGRLLRPVADRAYKNWGPYLRDIREDRDVTITIKSKDGIPPGAGVHNSMAKFPYGGYYSGIEPLVDKIEKSLRGQCQGVHFPSAKDDLLLEHHFYFGGKYRGYYYRIDDPDLRQRRRELVWPRPI